MKKIHNLRGEDFVNWLEALAIITMILTLTDFTEPFLLHVPPNMEEIYPDHKNENRF